MTLREGSVWHLYRTVVSRFRLTSSAGAGNRFCMSPNIEEGPRNLSEVSAKVLRSIITGEAVSIQRSISPKSAAANSSIRKLA